MSEYGGISEWKCSIVVIRMIRTGGCAMKKTDRALFEAFKAKDTRFDGRFFVGIASTKIYCRPVCRAKQARQENCTFFSTAAEAELAGYRPSAGYHPAF